MAPVQQWTLIAHHDLEGGLFDSSTKTSFIENAGDPSSSTYMIAGQDFSDNMVDGKYHLRLVYSGDSDTPDECAGSDWSGSVTLEWLQSSWVTEEAVTDFESVSEADISTSGGSLGCQFNGLARSTSGNSVLDGSPLSPYWYGSVGSIAQHQGGIPSFRGRIAQTMSLYVRRVAPEANPRYSAEPHVGVFLAGHAFGDSTIRPVDEALERCDELGNVCAGITCRSETSCTVRAGRDLRTSPSGEFSYVKETQTACALERGPRYSTGHAGIYLAGHAAGDSTIGTISDRMARCDELGNACAGITCHSEALCTVRAGRDLRTSPSHEVSFVKEEELEPWTLIAHQDIGAAMFDSTTRVSFLENAGDPLASTYMIAGQDFSDYMVDGKYRLRLVYSGDSDTPDECAGSDWSGSVTLEWLQSSCVTEEAVTDFESVSEADISTSGGSLGCQFNGLARSTSDRSVLDGSPLSPYWYGSVGSIAAHQGGIPSFRGRIAQSMSLYVSRL